MNLFDIIKIIFTSKRVYDEEVTRGDKKKNFFMINRRFAINYPAQANALNHIRIEQDHAVDIWQSFLSKKYSKPPYWIYAKGIKKAKQTQQEKRKIKDSVIYEYARINKLDVKSVKDALELFPDESYKELKKFEKTLD